MNQDEIDELFDLIQEHALRKGFTVRDVLAFNSLFLVNALALGGFSEEYVDEIFESLKNSYRKYRKNIEQN